MRSFTSDPPLFTFDVDANVKTEPFWILNFEYPGHGNVVAFEKEVAADLKINIEDFGGVLFPGSYSTEADACAVAVEMMRRRPELRVGICGSEPWMTPYVPIAHIEIKIDLNGQTID